MASRLDGYASGNLQGSADNRPPGGKVGVLTCCFPAFFVGRLGRDGKATLPIFVLNDFGSLLGFQVAGLKIFKLVG